MYTLRQQQKPLHWFYSIIIFWIAICLVVLVQTFFIRILHVDLHEMLVDTHPHIKVKGIFLSVLLACCTTTSFVMFSIKHFLHRNPIRYLGLDRFHVNMLSLVFAAYVGNLIITSIVVTILNKLVVLPHVNKQLVFFSSFKRIRLLYFLSVIIIGPFWEELLVRGFLQKGIIHNPLGHVGSICISAFFFSLLHWQWSSALVMVSTFIMGITFGWLRYTTQSVWTPILAHMLQNLMSTVYMFQHQNQ